MRCECLEQGLGIGVFYEMKKIKNSQNGNLSPFSYNYNARLVDADEIWQSADMRLLRTIGE